MATCWPSKDAIALSVLLISARSPCGRSPSRSSMRAARIAAACSVTLADAAMILQRPVDEKTEEKVSTPDRYRPPFPGGSDTDPSISRRRDSRVMALTLDERSGVLTPPLPVSWPDEPPGWRLISPDETADPIRWPLESMPSISLSSDRLRPISTDSIAKSGGLRASMKLGPPPPYAAAEGSY